MLLRRALLLAVAVWVAVSMARLGLSTGNGLRGQYFRDQTSAGPPAVSALDPAISTNELYKRWRAAPPDAFSVQWTGYLNVDRPGVYTLAITSNGESRLYVDRRLVLDNKSLSEPVSRSADVSMGAGPHAILLQYISDHGSYSLDWLWTRDHGTLERVPSWALSTTPRSSAIPLLRWLDPIWWTLTAAVVLLGAALAFRRAVARWPTSRPLWLTVRVALLIALGWFYLAGATEHSDVVNTFKARGDQNAYLWDAQQVYANWNGRTPPTLIGARVRMPIYAGYLALFYSPRLSDPEFFVVAKTWNIRLSLVLLAIFSVMVAWHLPPLLSINLTLIVSFGYFVFKAGYAQPELLFYFLFFATFVTCWHFLRERRPIVSMFLGMLGGVLAALAYLTKALLPPFVAIFLAICMMQEVMLVVRHSKRRDALRRFAWRAASSAAMAACFLAVVYPYIANSKRISGHYFYNLNTTFYMWYDNGVVGRATVYPETDPEGRLLVPPDRFPNLAIYLSSHSIGQIVSRVVDGLKDTAIRSYNGYAFLKYVVLYLAFALVLISANRRAFLVLIRERAALLVFLVLYAVVYLTGTAFFVPTSGTGGVRFLLAHVAPLLFVLSCFFARAPFSATEWTLVGVRVTPTHFNFLILVMMGFELTFTLWQRVMSTYGGF